MAKTTRKRVQKSKAVKSAEPQNKRTGKSRILRAAMTAFARNSFDAVSLPEIAQAAGLGGPSVHYHFGSKDNLWRETVDYAFKDLLVRLEAVDNVAKDAKPEAALRMLWRAFANFSMEYPESAMLITNELRNPGPRVDWITERYLKRCHEIFDLAVERGVAAGEIKAVSSIHFTNAMIGSITNFYSTLPLMGDMYGDQANDPKTGETYADFLIDMIFNGVLVKK